MLLYALVVSVAVSAPQDSKQITLNRVFAKNERLVYSVDSNIHVEERQYPLQTFIPAEVELSYKFTTDVRDLKNDGVAVVHYQRPSVVQVDGETFERPPKTTIEKLDWNFDLTVSPINEILEKKDLNPPKKKKPTQGGGDGSGDTSYLISRVLVARQNPIQTVLGQFVGEVYRLALNVGSMDSALDFSPKLPADDVKVGDSWKKTVSYQPQKLKDQNGKQAVQRLDYTFTYKGLVTVEGKQFYRVTAALNLSTDLGAFINQMLEAKPDQTHLKSIPLTLKQSIDYDLDLTTKRTVQARSQSEGGFNIEVTDMDGPVVENKLKGSTLMKLVSIGTTPPVKPPVKHGGGHGRE